MPNPPMSSSLLRASYTKGGVRIDIRRQLIMLTAVCDPIAEGAKSLPVLPGPIGYLRPGLLPPLLILSDCVSDQSQRVHLRFAQGRETILHMRLLQSLHWMR